METSAYGAASAVSPLTPLKIPRRAVGPHDVLIDIAFCGICHSDIHFVRNEWGNGVYPAVPGHEIVGRIRDLGDHVSGFKKGQLVGVGCMVDSCRTCPSCTDHLEQYCDHMPTWTYGSPDRALGGHTHGGYSGAIVVDEGFVLRIPETLDVRAVAPLLCAGITTWSPLAHWKVGKGDRVGVIGLGGLGHMGVKFANALGAQVVMITTSPSKGEDARKLGAHEVLISKDDGAMHAASGQFDFLLNTIPVAHDVNPYLKLLKRDKTMVMVGALEPLAMVNSGLLVRKRLALAGSLIGGIQETQDMLDFCGQHNIVSDVEMTSIQKVNEAYDRVVKADVKYRFVIDMATLTEKA